MAEINDKDLYEEIQKIYKAFAKPAGRGNTVGCVVFILGIIAVVALWIFFSWKIAVPSIVAFIVLITIIYSAGDKHGLKAKKAMDDLHEKYSQTPEQSLELFKKKADMTVLEVKEFIKHVWGEDISEKSNGSGKSPKKARLVCSQCNRVPAMIMHNGTASCYTCDITWKVPVKPACPHCGSENVKSKLESTTQTAGSMVGGALLGVAGSALGVKYYWTYKCLKCGAENWSVKLTEEAKKTSG